MGKHCTKCGKYNGTTYKLCADCRRHHTHHSHHSHHEFVRGTGRKPRIGHGPGHY